MNFIIPTPICRYFFNYEYRGRGICPNIINECLRYEVVIEMLKEKADSLERR